MRRFLAWAMVCLASAISSPLAASAAPADLVIVVDENSPIRGIPIADVRRRYLGIPLVVNGVEVIPVRNLADGDLYEVFLQRVLFMSAESYERRMLTRIFREGGESILAVTSRDELQRILRTDPRRVTFVPRAAVSRTMRIVAEP